MPEEHGAWVPVSQLSEDLRRLSEIVIRIDERMAQDKTHETVADLETRVSALEQRVWRAAGVATTLGALVGVAVPFLTR